MRGGSLRRRRRGVPPRRFNSLFEMPGKTALAETFLLLSDGFNSLFEMHAPLDGLPPQHDSAVSILYLRCRAPTAYITPPSTVIISILYLRCSSNKMSGVSLYVT